MSCNCNSCDKCLSYQATPYITILDRPDVHCSFHVMDQCNSLYQNSRLASACREGARDAHLLSDQLRHYKTQSEQNAYDSGRNTTFMDCTPVLFR